MQEPTMCPDWEGRRKQPQTPGAEVKRTENESVVSPAGVMATARSQRKTMQHGKPAW